VNGGTLIRHWNRFWYSPGSATDLGICRALFFGALCLWQADHDFSAWATYSHVFWMPIWLFATFHVPVLSVAAIGWLQLMWKIALLLSALGLFARPAMLIAFVLGTYLMGLPHNFGQTQHFDTLVVFASGALAISSAADAFSIDAWLARRRGVRRRSEPWEYTWPIRFVWVAMALIFCAAGISKLRHSGLDWVLSDNLALLLLRQQYHISDGEPLTRWGVWVANHQWVVRGLAAFSVATETLFPLALFTRYTRLVIVPAGLAMLIGIRVLMGPTFEQFMMCYVFWVPWQRILDVVHARRTGARARAHAAA
jgi:hypothetical protein